MHRRRADSVKQTTNQGIPQVPDSFPGKGRNLIIAASLLALFLGAMDALIIAAAMPTIVSDLGGLHLYAWVYSAYFLARAISLPIFGKLSDLFNCKRLFIFSIALFLLASVAAGVAQSMIFLIVSRVFQGIGAGGIFALVYIVLSTVAQPGKRAKTLSLASSVWGISSVIGPTLGGILVTYFSWRWIFFINIPLGIICLSGIGVYLQEPPPQSKDIKLDIAGVVFLSSTILAFLTLFITGGQEYPWASRQVFALLLGTLFSGVLFYLAEKRAEDPILDLNFFTNPAFALGNGATFFASFTIFSLFAYAPLFIQGALGKTPMQVGIAMLSLSLGWSFGSLFLGRFVDNAGAKSAAVSGALILLSGTLLTLGFSAESTMTWCFLVFHIVGLGMGYVTLSTLLIVQNALSNTNLGVATSFHQFARTLGGTVGVGICGGVITTRLLNQLQQTAVIMPPEIVDKLKESTENLFREDFHAQLSPDILDVVQQTVANTISWTFWVVSISAILCTACCLLLPRRRNCESAQGTD